MHLVDCLKDKIRKSFHHVRGHMDRVQGASLSEQEQMNVQVDSLATSFRNSLQRNHILPFPTMVPDTPWQIRWENTPLQGNIRSVLKSLVDGIQLDAYWLRKGRYTLFSKSLIDWEVVEKVTRSLTFGRRIWLTKHISGFAGVGIWLNRWNRSLPLSCPWCGEMDETTKHVIQCTSPGVTANWSRNITQLSEWMKSKKIAEVVIEGITESLLQWQRGGEPSLPQGHWPAVLRETIVEQNTIGWWQCMCGLTSRRWRDVLLIGHTFVSRYSGCRLIVALVGKLFDVAFDMWDKRNAEAHSRDGRIFSEVHLRLVNRIQTSRDRSLTSLWKAPGPACQS